MLVSLEIWFYCLEGEERESGRWDVGFVRVEKDIEIRIYKNVKLKVIYYIFFF